MYNCVFIVPLAIKNEQREQQIRQPGRIVSQRNVFQFSMRRQQVFKVFLLRSVLDAKSYFKDTLTSKKQNADSVLCHLQTAEARPTLERNF